MKVLLVALACGLWACGSTEGFDNGAKDESGRSGAPAADATDDEKSADGTKKAKPGAKPAPGATTDGGDAADGTSDGGDATDGTSDGTVDGGADDGGPDGDAKAGEAFYTTKVLPMLQASCIGCHADPRIKVEVRAPLSIYSYTSMHALLMTGKNSEDNDFFNKVRNVTSHTGGDRCTKGLNTSPCKELIDWWHVEFGEDGGGTVKIGRVTEVTSLGKAYGYAFDPADNTKAVSVSLYIDGAKGTGTAAGTTMANVASSDNNTPGDHAFIVELPAAFRNGKAHDLYAYAMIDGVETAISDTATHFTAYSFTQAGRDYYAANVQGKLGVCQACHVVSYEQQYYSLIAPSPAQGATALNNQLINKPSQTNGTVHGGAQRCASANASPCTEFQAWWKLEFGG